MKITQAVLERMVYVLNRQEGRPVSHHNSRPEPYRAHPGHVALDHNFHYGGYCLRVNVAGGGEGFYWPESGGRVSGKEMASFLEGKLHAPNYNKAGE